MDLSLLDKKYVNSLTEKARYIGGKMSEEKSENPKIWRIVLDVLKPHDPSLPEFAEKIGAMEGVEGVDASLLEIDRETETLKITVDGDLDYDKIRSKIEEWGGVVHSVDEVVVGEKPIG